MTMEANVFGDDALRRTPEGYEIRMGLPSYRSLPLSCVEGVSVTVDGWTPDDADLRILRDGRRLTVTELNDTVDEEWFVLDKLVILAPDAPPANGQDEIDLEVRLQMRIPYVIMGPGLAMIQKTHLKRKVAVR